jgi:predicted dehydrogenase
MVGERNEIGLAIIGCGTIGRIRAEIARDYPGVGWLGLCDIKEDLGKKLAEDTGADFFTTNYEELIKRPEVNAVIEELIKRPEVNAVIISTDENHHMMPTLAAVEQGHKLFIEKPLATDVKESQRVLDAIEAAGIDAVIGYTNRFRRRFLAIKERLNSGQIGQVTGVVTRAIMNRMVPIATVQRTNQRENLTPMVVSGTHALDMSMWLMEGKSPVSIYARSNDLALSQYGTKDSTFGLAPVVWPGAVYGLEIGIIGNKGVIDIEDTHRDLILATEVPQGGGYVPDGFTPEYQRHVDFLTSYPAGDTYDGQFWGPMREETNSWFQRLYTGMRTPHATAAEGHRNLLLTMAMDLSSARGEELKLPLDLDEYYR